MPYRRILVATDMSEAATQAARAAAAMAGADAETRVLHVLPAAAAPLLERASRREERERADQQRAKQAEDALGVWAQRAGIPRATPRARRGMPSLEIVREAREWHADLVVAGAVGESAFERILLGSTARPILRDAPCDVLLGRAGALPPRRILVATDFHAPSRRAAERALAIAKRHGAELHLLHAIDPVTWSGVAYEDAGGKDALDEGTLEKTVLRMMDAFDRDHLGGLAKQKVVYERAPTAVLARAKEVGADLIVVGTHGAGMMERALLGSVAEVVAERAPCSVLMVRGL